MAVEKWTRRRGNSGNRGEPDRPGTESLAAKIESTSDLLSAQEDQFQTLMRALGDTPAVSKLMDVLRERNAAAKRELVIPPDVMQSLEREKADAVKLADITGPHDERLLGRAAALENLVNYLHVLQKAQDKQKHVERLLDVRADPTGRWPS